MFQDLPVAFSVSGFNGNKHLYLINTQGVRTKVRFVTPYHRPMALKGYKWTEFAKANIGSRVRLLHFIQEGDDTYYVTGYDKDGIELGGYISPDGRYSRYQCGVWGVANRAQVLYLSKVKHVLALLIY